MQEFHVVLCAGRPKQDQHSCWTVLSRPQWAESALSSEAECKSVANPATGNSGSASLPHYAVTLLHEFQTLMQGVLKQEVPQPVFVEAQRWGSAFKAHTLDVPCLTDPALGLVACGDFCLESSAEGALFSGLSAAAALQDILKRD